MEPEAQIMASALVVFGYKGIWLKDAELEALLQSGVKWSRQMDEVIRIEAFDHPLPLIFRQKTDDRVVHTTPEHSVKRYGSQQRIEITPFHKEGEPDGTHCLSDVDRFHGVWSAQSKVVVSW